MDEGENKRAVRVEAMDAVEKREERGKRDVRVKGWKGAWNGSSLRYAGGARLRKACMRVFRKSSKAKIRWRGKDRKKEWIELTDSEGKMKV